MVIKNKTWFTTHPSSDREKKNLLFLSLIKKEKSISRTEIAKLTNITVVTVSNYINGYLKKGLVLERGYDVSSGGRRPELVEINKKWGYTIGIDISKNCTRTVLMNSGAEALAEASFPACDKNDLSSSIKKIADKFISDSKIDKTQLKKIAISISNNPRDLTIEDLIKVKDEIEDAAKFPILMADAALSGACGEKTLNPDLKENSKILYIYSDIGRGIFIKGDEFYEAREEKNKFAYLKQWGKNLSIINEAKRIINWGVGTKIVELAKGNNENITVEAIIESAGEKDEVALDLIKTAGMNLGVRVAYLINSLEPEIAVIGGGIEKAGDLFLVPLSLSINKFISQKMSDKIKVMPALLAEDACAKGGATLALREMFIEA